MKIIFFGASVTAQTTNSSTNQISGYYPLVLEYFARNHPNIMIDRIAAGSSHFDNAGYCLLDKAIEKSPDILFIDWNSTGSSSFDPLLFNSFLAKLSCHSIFPVFMLLPRASLLGNHMQRRNVQQVYDKVANSSSILDLYKELNINSTNYTNLLRDECHTNNVGAKAYAEVIIERLNLLLKQRLNQPHGSITDQPVSSIIPVSVKNVSSSFIKASRLEMQLEVVKTPYSKITIILENKIGPYSPVCSLKGTSIDDTKFSVWDPYCHYERANFTSIPSIRINDNSEKIEICIESEKETETD